MAKIVKISGKNVYIGTDNGSMIDFHREDLDFIPEVGKDVEIYTTGDTHTVVVDGHYYYVEKKTTNKYLYCCLAFFVGGIGLHKLYAKKYVAFLIYLLCCWTCLPAFISIVDLFIAMFKKADRYGNIKI